MSSENEQRHEVLTENYDEIIKMISLMGIQPDYVEDVAIDVYIDALRGIDELKSMEKLRPWLYKIAKRKSCKCFKEKLFVDEISKELYYLANTNKYSERTPLDRKLLWESVERLGEPSSTVLHLKYCGGYTFQEIADMLAINPSTVRSINRRGLLKLKENMDDIRNI